MTMKTRLGSLKLGCQRTEASKEEVEEEEHEAVKLTSNVANLWNSRFIHTILKI